LWACQRWNLFSNWTIPVVMMLTEALLVLRVGAMYRNSQKVYIPLWILFVCCTASNFAIAGVTLNHTWPTRSPAPSVVGCVLSGSERLFWLIWIPTMVMETTLFVLTVVQVVHHMRAGADETLVQLVLRDGFLYFIVIFALLLANIIICVSTTMLFYSIIVQMTLTLSSIMASRLFLNLRHAARRKELEENSEKSSIPEEGEVDRRRNWREFRITTSWTSSSDQPYGP